MSKVAMHSLHVTNGHAADGRHSLFDETTATVPEAHAATKQQAHHHGVPVVSMLSSKDIYEHIVDAGAAKSQWRWDRQMVLGVLAGCYIGFSFMVMMVIGGQLPYLQDPKNGLTGLYNLIYGAFGFPLGLYIIVTVGADLYTSNVGYMMVALHEGRITMYHLVKCVVLSWWMNCGGGMFMALLVYWAAIFEGREDYTLHLAHKKVHYTFGVCLCKSILANWLVNLAVWLANGAQDNTGKAVGIFLPIMAFIAIGGEHCIANQFLFTLAKLLGSDITMHEIIVGNLIPSTIGNFIGGAFFVGTMYAYGVGSMFDTTYAAVGRTYSRLGGKPVHLPKFRFGPHRGEPGVTELPVQQKAASFVQPLVSKQQQQATHGSQASGLSSLDTSGVRDVIPAVAAGMMTSTDLESGHFAQH